MFLARHGAGVARSSSRRHMYTKKPPARAVRATRYFADTPRTPPPLPPPPLPPTRAPRPLTHPNTWARPVTSSSSSSTTCANARFEKSSPTESSINSRLRRDRRNPHPFSQPEGVVSTVSAGRGAGSDRCLSSSAAPTAVPVDSARRTTEASVSSLEKNQRRAAFSACSVDPAAAEQEEKLAHLCSQGNNNWRVAVEGLQSIRDAGLKPSMAAHMNVVTVCRRALRWSQAQHIYRQMIEAYLPLSGTSTVFEDMACDDYKDETEDTLARACGIVVEMGRKGVKPNNGTYRALLDDCRDQGRWREAVLLFEEARRSKVKLNVFFFDLLISTVFDEGYEEASTMLYEIGVLEEQQGVRGGEEDEDEEGAEGRALELDWPCWPMKAQGRALALELHNLPLRIALATVQVALLDVVRMPESRSYWSGQSCLRVITGMGNNSRDGEAVIKPAVAQMLEDMGLKPEIQQRNEGCIELKPSSLEAYAYRIKFPEVSSTTGAATAVARY